MSPATQMVVAAGWLGTRRAIQAMREGVTDLGNWHHLKLTFLSPGVLGPGWRQGRTSIHKETPSHLFKFNIYQKHYLD